MGHRMDADFSLIQAAGCIPLQILSTHLSTAFLKKREVTVKKETPCFPVSYVRKCRLNVDSQL